MTNKKSIIWEKWKDPFGFDEEDEILSNSLNEPEYDDELDVDLLYDAMREDASETI